MSELDPIERAEPISAYEEPRASVSSVPATRPAQGARAPAYVPRKVFPEGAGAIGAVEKEPAEGPTVPAQPLAEPAAPAAPAKGVEASPAISRFALPEGARCAVHSEREALFVCTRCGVFGCEPCAFTRTAGIEVCRGCASAGLPEPIPWERRKEIGNLRAFWATVKLVSFSPRLFFRTPPTEKGAAWPILFGTLAYGLGQALWQLQLGLLIMLGGGVTAAALEAPELGAVLGVYGCVVTGLSPMVLLQAPFYGIVSTSIVAAAEHGLLTLMKKKRGSFEDTLRVVAYSNGPLFFACIPLLGPLIGYLWSLYVEILALREQHNASTDRAALAVLGFRALLFLVFGGMYAVMLAALVLLEGRQLAGDLSGL